MWPTCPTTLTLTLALRLLAFTTCTHSYAVASHARPNPQAQAQAQGRAQHPLASQQQQQQQQYEYEHTTGQPLLGFGTWNLDLSPSNTTAAVAYAVNAGYRQIDCAAAYGNEVAVGKGIALGLEQTGLTRRDLWVTSKLWNDHHDPSRVEAALRKTLADLDTPYLDLYLMHWPVGKGPDDEAYKFDYVSTWKAMSALLTTKLVRHIGISNFSPAQLDDLLAHGGGAKPSVHQMETHPYLQQADWIAQHQAHGISVTAYSPLANMNPTYGERDVDVDITLSSLTSSSSPSSADTDTETQTTKPSHPLLLHHPLITRIASARGCSPAQVVLSWGMQRGTSVIPKSSHRQHIRDNFLSVACALRDADVRDINGLGSKPRRYNNPSKGWGVRLFEGLEDA